MRCKKSELFHFHWIAGTMAAVGFLDTILYILSNVGKFEGRAPRRHVVYWVLLNVFFLTPVVSITMLTLRPWETAPFFEYAILYVFLFIKAILFLAGLSLIVRRLHDIDMSGLWCIAFLLPVIGYFLYFYWLIIKPGAPGKNQYGEPWKE